MNKLTQSLISCLFLLLAQNASAGSGVFGCVRTSNTCTDANSTHMVQPYNCPGTCAAVAVQRPCWNYAETWTCYTGAQQSTCTPADLTGCYVANSTPTTYAPDGNAIAWNETYICPGQATTTCTSPTPIPAGSSCDTAGATTGCNSPLVYGVCTDSTTNTECATGPAPACNTDSNCTLNNTATLSTSPSGSFAETVTQNYSCSTSTTSCIKWASISNCVGNLTWGLDQGTTPQPNNGFGQAMSSLTMLEAIQHSANSGAVTVFAGLPYTCEKGTGLFGFLYANCCDINLKSTGTNGSIGNACDQQDVLLAASRRANLVHYIGEYCSAQLNLGLTTICTKDAYTYCGFDNALAKAVNEQGRDQLAAMAAAGTAGAQVSSATQFAYYAPAGNTTGNWLALPQVNGNTTYVFQWPSYCASPATESAQMKANPLSPLCPTDIELYFASCSEATCDTNDLPSDPTVPANANSSSGTPIEWNVQQLTDVLTQKSTAVDRYVAVTGSCTPSSGDCSYAVSAWPAGTGGSAVVRSNMTFMLYNGGYQGNQSFELTKYVIEPQSLNAPVTAVSMPATITVNVSSDGGVSFTPVSIPTSILAPGITLPGTPIQLYGSCDANSQQCEYNLSLPITVTAMTWGTAQAANCAGFNLDDLAVLDFSKMNLSQWLASIVPPSAPNGSALTSEAQSQIATFTSAYQSTGTGPAQAVQGATPAQAFIVTPNQVDNQQVNFVGTTNWPQVYSDSTANTNPVSSVRVDWGDGTVNSATMGTYGSQNTPAFVAAHTYAVPPSGSVNYTVTATFQTASSGPQTSTATVESYSTPAASGNFGPGDSSNGIAPNSRATYNPVPVNTLQVPGVPTPSITP